MGYMEDFIRSNAGNKSVLDKVRRSKYSATTASSNIPRKSRELTVNYKNRKKKELDKRRRDKLALQGRKW